MGELQQHLDKVIIAETSVRPRDEVTVPFRFVLRVSTKPALDKRLTYFEYIVSGLREDCGLCYGGFTTTSLRAAERELRKRANREGLVIRES